MAAFKRIIVPTDFSKHSKHALGAAVVLARQFHSDVYLVNVTEDPILLTPFFGETLPMYYGLPEVQKAMQEKAAAELQKIAKNFKGSHVICKVLRGKAAPTLCTYAAACQADLIILSTHGLGFVRKALMGSTTDYVLKHCKLPVLVVQ